MRFRRPAPSGNVEDRRGSRIPGGAAGAGGIGGILLLLILVGAAIMGVDVGGEEQTIATCGVDRTIRLWRRVPTSLNGHSDSNEVFENGNDQMEDVQV